jgi:hypothetical protein
VRSALAAAVAVVCLTAPAKAALVESAVFALVIGVNASPEPELPPLQYADDDAARYLDLFRALGARTYLLARPDENTRRLHAQASAEAIAPRRQELTRTLAGLGKDVEQARARGVPTVLYVVYAGHGTVLDAKPYLTLEDARLSGDELLSEVTRVGADRSHVIVDACQAYLMAYSRGAGGQRRPLRGFLADSAARTGNVGLLLASSSSGESHEWAGFQAGVFSHEVRSGLYGAADADGDGRVTYDEIAAFVERANQAVENDRFRPTVLARAPRDGGAVVDLRGVRGRALKLDGASSAAHYLLEDERGVRILDFHQTEGATVLLARPAVAGTLYLRRVSDGLERAVPPSDEAIAMDALPSSPARALSRGAAHASFGKVFSLAFDVADVTAYRRREDEVQLRLEDERAREVESEARDRRRRFFGWTATGGALAAGAAAGALFVSANRLNDVAPLGESHRDTVVRNEQIDARNAWGTALAATSAALVGVAVYLFWPRKGP